MGAQADEFEAASCEDELLPGLELGDEAFFDGAEEFAVGHLDEDVLVAANGADGHAVELNLALVGDGVATVF